MRIIRILPYEVLLNKKSGDTLNNEESQYVNEIKDYVYKLEKVDEATYKVVYAYVTTGTKGSFFTEIN